MKKMIAVKDEQPSGGRSSFRIIGSDTTSRKSARDRIIDAAEKLFGVRGIASVSLREIAIAAGQRNNSAVNYYFGNKEGLLAAILSDRGDRIEKIYRQLLEKETDLSVCSPHDLLKMLWQPMLDLRQIDGYHHLIRFMLAYQVERAAGAGDFIRYNEDYVAAWKLMSALFDHFGHLPFAQCRYRYTLIIMMFFAAVTSHDHLVNSAGQNWSSKFDLNESICIAIGALSAPVSMLESW